jgi:hypothetical protein
MEDPGEVVVMTKAKEKPATESQEKNDDSNEAYRKEFAELPLEKKIANLVQLESIALGETVSVHHQLAVQDRRKGTGRYGRVRIQEGRARA